MREPISLKELLAILIKKGTFIICLTLIVALVLGGYKGYSQLQQFKLPENTLEAREKAYRDAMTLYEFDKADLERGLLRNQVLLERQNMYMEKSVLMHIDPLNTAVSTTVYTVTGADDPFLSQTQLYNEDRYDYMTSKVQNFYTLYWNTLDLDTALTGHTYEDVEEKYLDELIDVSTSEYGTITITTYGETLEAAKSLADAAHNCITAMESKIDKEAFPHDLEVVNSVTKYQVNSYFEGLQDGSRTAITNYTKAINDYQTQIDQLTIPQMSAGITTASIVKAAIKWAAIGAVVGFVLACAWILVVYLLCCKIESSRHMEQYLAVPFLGSVAPVKCIWAKLAAKLMSERSWQDSNLAKAYVAASIDAELEDKEQVAIISTLNLKGLSESLKSVEEAAANVCKQVYTVCAAESNADLIRVLSECKYVVLAERLGKSGAPEMLAVIDIAKRMGAKVIGFVTV